MLLRVPGTSASSRTFTDWRTLVALRIALGLTQRQLAERLDVNESQVSRDERNEYHGITVDRARSVSTPWGVNLKSAFEGPVLEKSTATVNDGR